MQTKAGDVPAGERREPRTSYSLRTDCPTSVSPRGRRRDHVRVRVDGFKALTQDCGPDVAAQLKKCMCKRRWLLTGPGTSLDDRRNGCQALREPSLPIAQDSFADDDIVKTSTNYAAGSFEWTKSDLALDSN